MSNIQSSCLGKKSFYKDQYDNSLIHPIARQKKRYDIGIDNKKLPFYGYDIFNAYEVSWLAPSGKPEVYIAEIIYPCNSEYLIESKSLKLYLNSFNGTIFHSKYYVRQLIQSDISNKLKTNVLVKLIGINKKISSCLPEGELIDSYYSKHITDSDIKTIAGKFVQNEQIYSNLLKSNCPVTLQPDWGTLMITYSGLKINPFNLLRYIISLRNMNEFHEQCIEKIYMEIDKSCQPYDLQVYGRYTRRGGIDINPFRSKTDCSIPSNIRNFRQ